jgi:hypothetical protein
LKLELEDVVTFSRVNKRRCPNYIIDKTKPKTAINMILKKLEEPYWKGLLLH